MKRLFIFTMMCLLGAFSLKAQTSATLDPVKWVKATENATSVDVSWNIEYSTTDYEDFEEGGLAARDWKNSEQYPWVLTETAYEGQYAMKSTAEGVDKAVSSIELEYETTEAGFVSFYHKVSSEAKYDKGNFYVDEELLSSTSGDKDWKYVEFYIEAGKHVYKWEYAKDSLTDTGADSYFVDNISFYKEATPFEGGWISYDNDEYLTAIGQGSPSAVYWGVSFPITINYKDLALTKVAIFDSEMGGSVNMTANIYLGGETAPEDLVSTQEFETSGAGEMLEVELATPVILDGTKSLWITFYCDESSYPASACATVDNSNSDWLSLDGLTWSHAYEYGLDNSFIIRGYLENADGKSMMLSSKPAFEGETSTGNFIAKTDVTPKYIGSLAVTEEFASKYNVYKKNIHTGEVKLVAEETENTTYTDNDWTTVGAFQYGVAALYSDELTESEIVWSNTVAKDMFTKVTVDVKTDSNDPVAGTEISFVNSVEEKYNYSVILGQDGKHVFDNFRKGSYKVTVAKNGFTSEYNEKNEEIWDETTIDLILSEILYPISDLYVSPTGWAMWNGKVVGSGDEFYYDFDDCTLDGWTTIDADRDNYTWLNSCEVVEPGHGHNGSIAFATSFSCLPDGTWEPLNPDNYLVTEKMYNIGNASQLRFWVCAQDKNWPAEHYGVAISLNSNTDPETFVTIWEETLTAKSGNANAVRGTSEAGTWYEKVVDLSSYAGQSVYIAIRHFNCTDMFFINVDDISLENASRNDRALEAYKVYLDDELVSENLATPYYQHENLEEGKEYTTKVVPAYTTKDGEAASYTWTYKGCATYQGVTEFAAEVIDGETVVSWTLPTDAQAEILGVMLYRNDELVSSLVEGTSFKDKKAVEGDEYAIRVVYGGEKDETYYAMSCVQTTTVVYNMPCIAPKDLGAKAMSYEDGRFGTLLGWPLSSNTSGYLYYDDGEYYKSVGGVTSYYWGNMFTEEMLKPYIGTNLTKVALYDNVAQEGTINIYYGGTTAPEALVHTQNYSTVGSEVFVEFNLTYPLPIDGTNIWVVLGTTNAAANFPSAQSAPSGIKNARWISMDGELWEDAADYGLDGTWMIRAFVEGGDRNASLSFENPNATRTPMLKNYKVYRGTSLDEMAMIATTTETTYFDEVDKGTYYYQVTAVYVEEGEECESDYATAYKKPEQNYVVVDVTSLSENVLDNLNIYPNPVKGDLNVECEAMTHITIANTLGQIVYDQDVDGGSKLIDMSQYETGIYMVRIISENGATVKRVSVVR